MGRQSYQTTSCIIITINVLCFEIKGFILELV